MREIFRHRRRESDSDRKFAEIDEIKKLRERQPSAISPDTDVFNAFIKLYEQATGEKFPMELPTTEAEQSDFFDLLNSLDTHNKFVDAYVQGTSYINNVLLESREFNKTGALEGKIYAQDIEALSSSVRVFAAYIQGKLDSNRGYMPPKWPTQITGWAESLESFIDAYGARVYLYKEQL